MPNETIRIPAADGPCEAYATWPDRGGPFAPVLMFMDGPGWREQIWRMADRIAAFGYFVLAPNLFYRLGADVGPLGSDSVKPDNRPRLLERVHTLTPERVVADAGCFLDALAHRPEVRPGAKAGLVGYCMGGAMTVRTAAAYPERVAAAAAFHGGRLANDAPTSPHLLLPRVTAELYFGHADQDAGMPPADIARLEGALEAAHVRHRSELYAGALHGYTMADLPVYNETAAERHYAIVQELFGRALAR